MIGSPLVLWLSVLMLVYTYAGYPLLLWMLSKRHAAHQAAAGCDLSISIVVVAFNEAERIVGRIDNLLALDYPKDKMEIVIASDGSTDETVDRVVGYVDKGVKVVEFGARRGKPGVLNDILPGLSSDIVVLMDVRQRINRGALRALVEHFADSQVGAVGGELILEQEGSEVGDGVGFYWRYETFIRAQESLYKSMVSVAGALYAIRTKLFEPIPEGTILDDVLIPLKIASKGYRVVYEPEAHAVDRIPTRAEVEFARKVRTIGGNFQLLFLEPWLLNPFVNRLWFQTVSHKFCRLFGPACLVGAFVANCALLDVPVYRITMGAQVAFYGVAVAGYCLRHRKGGVRAFNVAYSFCLLNLATLVAFFRFVTGSQRVTWEKKTI